MSVNSIIISTLTPLAPIDFHHYTGTSTTYMTFFTYNQRSGLIADDNELTTVHSIQLDIYSKGNLDELVKQVKESLKPFGFKRTSEIELFDQVTKVYRKTISFSVSLETLE